MKKPAENITVTTIGNTVIKVSDKYAARSPEEVEQILHRIAARAQQELSRLPPKRE